VNTISYQYLNIILYLLDDIHLDFLRKSVICKEDIMIELIIILRKAILDNWLIAFLIGLHDAILIDELRTLVVSRDIA